MRVFFTIFSLTLITIGEIAKGVEGWPALLANPLISQAMAKSGVAEVLGSVNPISGISPLMGNAGEFDLLALPKRFTNLLFNPNRFENPSFNWISQVKPEAESPGLFAKLNSNSFFFYLLLLLLSYGKFLKLTEHH
jgi:hypothetical protein